MEFKTIEGLYYSKNDEWVKVEEDVATIGISDYAQDKLGDVVYIEEVEVGKKVSKEEKVISIESVKAASDIYAPVSGEIIEANKNAVKNPAILNSDPYGEGWLFKIKFTKKEELNDLMDAKTYQDYRKE